MVQVQERIQPVERVEPPIFPLAEPTAPDRSWIVFALITLAGFLMRIWDLGSRAMHHDESLHAVYGWYLYVGRGYTHDPMMHGPFLFHMTALMYLLFGDSEVSFRLSFVLFGTASIALMYFLRNELGRVGSIAAAALLSFDTVFLYFSRFGHNEALLLFQELLVVVGMFGWLRTRRSAYVYAIAIGFGLMASTKLTWLLYAFICGSFVVAAIVYERLRGDEERPVLNAVLDIGLTRLAICVGIFVGIGVVLYTTFFTNLDGLCTAFWSPPFGNCLGKQGMLQYWVEQQHVARGSQPWFYYFLLIPLYAIVPLTLSLAAPFLAIRPRTLFFGFAAWWSLGAIVLYTIASEKMPWLVVHPTTPLVMLGALTIEGVSRHFHRPWGLTPRQWAVMGLGLLTAASFVALVSLGASPGADQFIAQAIVLRKIFLGLVMGALLIGTLLVSFGLTPKRTLGAVGAGVLGILLVYSFHTALQAVYRNGDVPVEMLVYVQSSPDVPFIAHEVERVSELTGQRKDMPLLLDGGYSENVGGQSVEHEAVSWPFEWYFRDYKAKQYFTRTLPNDFSPSKYPIVIAMGTNLDPIRDQLTGYTGNKFRLNWWYPEDYKQLTKETFIPTIWTTLTNPDARAKLWKYIIYRELMNPPLGAREVWFYERNDLVGSGSPLVPGAGSGANSNPNVTGGGGAVSSGVPTIDGITVDTIYGQVNNQKVLQEPKGMAISPEGRIYVVETGSSTVKIFNPDGTIAGGWGNKGSGDGEFNEPWGIAVGPDGSVYVADTWNHRIQKFDAAGRFLMKWGAGDMSQEPSKFYGPRDIAVTPSGQVLVTDTGNKRIQVFDANGTFIKAFGTEGTGPGQFQEPVGIAVDAQGKIYVADTWNERIQVFDASFQRLGEYKVTGWSNKSLTNKPYITVAPDGTLYATRPDGRSVLQIKDGLTAQLNLPSTPSLQLPTGIKADATGHLLVTDSQANTVISYDLPGDLPGGGSGAPESTAP